MPGERGAKGCYKNLTLSINQMPEYLTALARALQLVIVWANGAEQAMAEI
jgi:hypothetical protein